MIMRLVSFFILSLFLHATALVYPVSFGGRSPVETIQVKILPIEQEVRSAGGQGGNGKPTDQGDAKSHRRRPRAAATRVESKPASNPEPQVTEVEKVSDRSGALVSAIVAPSDSHGSAPSGSTHSIVHGAGTGAGGTGTSGAGYGTGTGGGSGNGNGSGSSRDSIALSQARYRDTPRPDYPDSARREGREGRVLLRVLVDDQGRSKQVEINSTSGSAALDRAAAEAIKRWRFHPARYGDQPVESWLRIPIEFRLADANAR
jgi:periplasmic protein TonB